MSGGRPGLITGRTNRSVTLSEWLSCSRVDVFCTGRLVRSTGTSTPLGHTTSPFGKLIFQAQWKTSSIILMAAQKSQRLGMQLQKLWVYSVLKSHLKSFLLLSLQLTLSVKCLVILWIRWYKNKASTLHYIKFYCFCAITSNVLDFPGLICISLDSLSSFHLMKNSIKRY